MKLKSKILKIRADPTIVAFDLDGTLLKGNSSFELARYLYKVGTLSWKDFFFCFQTYFHYWFRNLPLIDLHRTVFSRFCRGKTLESFTAHASTFIATKISRMLYSPAIVELQKWKERGAKIFLLSSSPDFLVKEVAKALGIAHGFGTKYLVDSEGLLTEIDYLLDGRAKALLLAEEGGGLARTVAYSDHFNDLPFLESVCHPIVVNPERRLKKIARKRGWQIL